MSITDSLKNDVAFSKTSSGDLGTINGLMNLERALFRRLVTVPGTLVHRPTYGVGVLLYQNAPATFAIQQKLSSLIQEQFEQDPRVESVTSVQFITEDDPRMTKIAVSIKVVGYTEQVMTFTPFGEANS